MTLISSDHDRKRYATVKAAWETPSDVDCETVEDFFAEADIVESKKITLSKPPTARSSSDTPSAIHSTSPSTPDLRSLIESAKKNPPIPAPTPTKTLISSRPPSEFIKKQASNKPEVNMNVLAQRLLPSWSLGLGALEYTALFFLILGVGVLSLGAYRYSQTMTPQAGTAIPVAKEPPTNESLAQLSANIITIPTATAAVKTNVDMRSTVFAYPWQKLINRLEGKHYQVMFSQALHPRLYLIQLARGVELNLLLSQNEKEVEEISLRLHMLEASDPVQSYRQIMADMQDILVDGTMREDSSYFQKLNLPLNLYSVPLPYAVSYESAVIKAELQILDPIYLNLRFVPKRPARSLPTQNIALTESSIKPLTATKVTPQP